MRVSEVDFFIVAIDQFLSNNSVHYFRVVSLIVLGNKLHTVVYGYDFRLDVQKNYSCIDSFSGTMLAKED